LAGEEGVFASSKDLRVAGLVSEGLAFANNGRLFNAESRLRQAYYLEPTNDRIAFNIAVVANQSGESDEALSILESLLAKDPKNPHYLQALADVWEAKGQHETAKVKLKEAFSIFKSAGNAPRAALVARSIANIAFGVGNEQEALCYSYEALTLAQTPPQVSAHARLLVGLNLFDQAVDFVRANKPLAGEPAAFHALAMALFAKGDMTAALEAEDNAVGRLAQAPELSQEINTAWWLMKARVPSQATVSSDWEEKMVELQEEAAQFAERAPYELVLWPAELRRDLSQAVSAK
jgi:tetratricopeptide (TPR) repeat protein